MKVVVLGATGNVGTSVLDALAPEDAVDEVVGVARREPVIAPPTKARWQTADVMRDELEPLFEGADAVVHLAWLIQPARDQRLLRLVNVMGSMRVFDAVARAGVPSLIYASSIGSYSPGPKEFVDESYPTEGIETAYYSRQKAATERMLDLFEDENPGVRVVRLRPSLIFKRGASLEQLRLFAGPFLPRPLLKPGRLPVVPLARRLTFQAAHTDDVADAYRRAVVSDARGAFNVAGSGVITPEDIADVLGAHLTLVPERALRTAMDVAFKLRLQPSPVDWFDMGVESPLMDCTRAERELGWRPHHSGRSALVELLEGIRGKSDSYTPPLSENPVQAAR